METTPLLTFIGLVPQILIEISISNFLERLDLVDRYQVRVEVHELDADLLEGPLRQQVPLHARQGLVPARGVAVLDSVRMASNSKKKPLSWK